MQKINLLNLFKKTQKRKHRGGGWSLNNA
jgi:hypothetical protein